MAEANIWRLNTFWTVVALGELATVVYTSLPPPPRHRMHLRDIHSAQVWRCSFTVSKPEAGRVQGIMQLISTLVVTPGLADPVVSADEVKPLLLTVPGWTGNTSHYGTGDGCHCAYGVWDPDCDRGVFFPEPTADAGDGAFILGSNGTATAPAVAVSRTVWAAAAAAPLLKMLSEFPFVTNCPASGRRYVPPVAAAAQTATAAACEQLSDESTCIADEECDWSLIGACEAKPTTPAGTVPGVSMCIRTSSSSGGSAGTEAVRGECGMRLEGWAGPGEMYGADGVCQCGRGLWDPDCDAVDFSQGANADSAEWGCPPFNAAGGGERYICQRDERRCAVEGLLVASSSSSSSAGLAAGYCLAVTSTPNKNTSASSSSSSSSSSSVVIEPPACPEQGGYLDPCIGENKSYVAGGRCVVPVPPPPPSPPPNPSPPPPARWSLDAVVGVGGYTAATFDAVAQR
jgi:hypothetical protein